jgi:hypothetical protein
MFPPSTQAAARWAKILLLAAIALFFTSVRRFIAQEYDLRGYYERIVLFGFAYSSDKAATQ